MIPSSFLIILLAFGAYGALHSLLAADAVKARAQQLLGAKAYRSYRLAFNLLSGLALLPVLYLVWRLPDSELWRIPWPWLLLTLAIQAGAGLGLLLSFRVTGSLEFLGMAQFLHLREPVRPERLRVDGLYRWMRHPIYSFSLLILWLAPVMSNNLLAVAVGVTLYIIVGTRLEERKLLRQFGEDYRNYQQTVPMFIPGLKLKRG
jgi:protein-S-isoprenylcysteine O-methyltransferase Ste14